MMRQFELVERVKSYDPNADEAAINRAYVYALKVHGSQKRASGDPYFSHPIEVAGILTRYKLDTSSIVTALLHDTIEDTEATQEEIEKLFGADIAHMVDGVTKLTRLELQSGHSKQAENFRKLVLAMSEDIRVLLVKLADRLHNMRTLHYVSKPEKRHRIALETMEIYVPLAERIGMSELKNELENLAFAELHPEVRASLIARLNYLREKGGDLISLVLEELRKILKEAGIEAQVSGREKTPYSIWHKMQQKNVAFEQLSDIMAFRLLVDSVEDCYRALGVIHSHYPMVPNRFKDYISTPKPNGYSSIHTGVFGPGRQRIEVQIRTREMHEIAELGVAAHWNYKQGGRSTEGKQYRWLRELLDILDHTSNPDEFLEHTKLEMFQDQVFCFTPRGDLIALPRGACPVDFAYAVHSQVGDACVGAKINGRIMPLRTPLSNGDQVEIITSKAQTPNPTWERFVVTGKARARIRRFVRTQQRAQYMDLGRAILNRAFKQERYEFTEKALEGVLKIFKAASVEDLVAQVGEGALTGREVVSAIYPELKAQAAEAAQQAKPKPKPRATGVRHQHEEIIRGLIPGMAMHFAGCCHPLPGDRIVGIIQTGKGVTVHTIDCDNLGQYANEPERWLDLSWNPEQDKEQNHTGRISTIVSNEPDALSVIATVISKNQGNVTNLRFVTRSTEFFELAIDIDVRDVKHLANVVAALRATPVVSSVERTRG